MQITRHWRMNAQRYRLEGVRYSDGTVSLQGRPNGPHQHLEGQEKGVFQETEEGQPEQFSLPSKERG